MNFARPTYQILFFFLIAQLLALIVGIILIENVGRFPEYQALDITPAAAGEVTNVFYLIGIIIIVAALLLIILILPLRDVMIRILEFIATIVASTVVFFVLFSVANIPQAESFAVVIAILLYGGKILFEGMRNALAIIASAGVASLIGFSIDPFPIILFVVLISVYDIVAVWWTGHMVKFAKHFVRMKTAFTVTAKGKKKIKKKVKGKWVTRLVPDYMVLGTGDLAIPAALCVSVYKLGSLIFPVATVVGGLCGLLIVLLRVEREKRVMPAMPSISLCSLLFLFVTIIVNYLLFG